MKSNKNELVWYSFANYFAIFLGYLSVIYIFPTNLEFLGKVRYVETIGFLISPFLLIGLPQSMINFFPLLEHYHARVFSGIAIKIILFLSIVTLFILIILNLICKFDFFHYYLLGNILAIFLSLIEFAKSEAITINKVSIVVIIEKISPRILVSLLFGLLFFNFFNQEELLFCYVLSYFITYILIFNYISKFSKPNFNFRSEYLFENFTKTEFFKFSFFSFLGSFGMILAFKLDTLMIPYFLDMKSNGIYSISVTFSSLIAVPSTAIFAVNSPIISKLIKENKIRELGIIYKKNAKILFFLGSIFYACFIVSASDFREYFLPQLENYETVLMLVYILSFSVLVNIGTGFNSEIIHFSKYYRFNIYIILVMILLTFVLNYIFLIYTDLKLIGVAIATTISVIIFNFSKLIFIYIKFKIFPFDENYLWILIISIISALLISLLPDLNSPLLNLLVKCLFIIIVNHLFVKQFKLLKTNQ